MKEYDEIEDQEIFRDSIATVDQSGKRIWIYPKQPVGKFYNWRKWISYLLLVVLFILPFIKYKGRPFVQFNIPETEFILFGVYFAPQDFHLFVVAMLIGMVFIVLFTVIFGRLFCGWVCPQTIFMEMVFRRIEYWIEGDANAQRRLDKSEWNTDKVVKKTAKHIIFVLIAVVIAHTFLSYIIGVDELYKLVTEPLSEHWKGFVAMVVFTAVFYGVFAFLREQVCTTVCPYGRLQGVLLDDNSLAVAYDYERGEPRGKIRKNKQTEAPPLGDCVDCRLCVQVCPTGIDIRNGTQLECVNCTACMDACDQVMEKIDRPLGLVRIDSYNGIKNRTKSLLNTRVVAYSIVLVMLIGLESFLFMSRSSMETLFLRTPGMLFQRQDDGYISNLYNYQLINKSEIEGEIQFKSESIEGILIEPVGMGVNAVPFEITEGAVFIKIPEEQLKGRKNKVKIEVYNKGELVSEANTNFFGPIK